MRNALERSLESAQRRVVSAVRATKRARRNIAECRGDFRYSRPALDDLDRQLERFLPDCGVFVEAGANDGYRFSNTYYLERCKDWLGLLVEPVPELARIARRQRKAVVINAALVAPDYGADTIELCAAGMTTVISAVKPVDHEAEKASLQRPIMARARTLESILHEHRITPTFLSLDVEGYELQALAGLNLERNRPDWILIEGRDGCDQIDAALGSLYRAADQLSSRDFLYQRSD